MLSKIFQRSGVLLSDVTAGVEDSEHTVGRMDGYCTGLQKKMLCSHIAVESNFGACVSLHVCFYLLTTHLKGLVCVVGVFLAVIKSPWSMLILGPTQGLASNIRTRFPG